MPPLGESKLIACGKRI